MPQTLILYREGERKIFVTYPDFHEESAGKSEIQIFKESLLQYLNDDPYFKRKMEKAYPLVEFYDDTHKEYIELTSHGFQNVPLASMKLAFRFQLLETPPRLRNNQDVEIAQDETDRACRNPSVARPLIFNLPEDSAETLIRLGAKSRGAGGKSYKRKKPRFTEESCRLPDFSEDVMQQITSKTVTLNTGLFIKECSQQLLQLTLNRPTSSEYRFFVLALLKAHPNLAFSVASGTSCVLIIKKKMSQFIRNIRRPEENLRVQPGKRKRGCVQNVVNLSDKNLNHLGQHVAPESVSSDDISTENDESDSEGGDLNLIAVAELANSVDEQENLDFLLVEKPSVQVLDLKLPAVLNKIKEMVNSTQSISDILKACPGLSSCESIYRIYLLQHEVTSETFSIIFEAAVEHIGRLKSSTCSSELEKLKLIQGLEEEITQSCYSNYTRAINIELIDGDCVPAMPTSLKSNGPVSITYGSTNGDLKALFVLSEGQQITSVQNPTASLAVGLLIGSYYTFNRDYPLNLKNLLDALDFVFFGKNNFSTSQKLRVFKKAFNQLKM